MRLSLVRTTHVLREGVIWLLNGEGRGYTYPWIWGYFERQGVKLKEGLPIMKYASAYFVTEPNVEILIFIDEPSKELPENCSMIVETKDATELLNAVESFFILGAGS